MEKVLSGTETRAIGITQDTVIQKLLIVQYVDVRIQSNIRNKLIQTMIVDYSTIKKYLKQNKIKLSMKGKRKNE